MDRALRTALGAMAVGITEKQKQIRNKKITELIETAYSQIRIGMTKNSVESILGQGNVVKVTNKYYITRYFDTYTESTSTSIYTTGMMGVKTGRIKCYIEVKYNMEDVVIEIIKKGIDGIHVSNENYYNNSLNNSSNINLDKIVKYVEDFDDEKYLDITGRDVLFYQIGYLCCLDKYPNEYMINMKYFNLKDDDEYTLDEINEKSGVNEEDEDNLFTEENNEDYKRINFIILQLISEGVIRVLNNTVFTPTGSERLVFKSIMTAEEFVAKYKLDNSNIDYHSLVIDYNTDNEYEKDVILTEKYNYDKNYDRSIYCSTNNRDKKFFEVGMLILSQNKESFVFEDINVLIRNRLEIDNKIRLMHILDQLEEAFVLRTNCSRIKDLDDDSNHTTYIISMSMSEFESKYSNGANKVYYKNRREFYDFLYGKNDDEKSIDKNEDNDIYLNGKSKTLIILSCIIFGIYGIHNLILGELKKMITKLLLVLVIYFIYTYLLSNKDSLLNFINSVASIFLLILWIRDLIMIIKGTYEIDSDKWI